MQNSHLKNGKAVELDEILIEEIRNFGSAKNVGTEPAQRVLKNKQLIETLETDTCCCPSDTWKGHIEPEKFQTIFGLYHYKLYERLVLDRLCPIIEHVLIPEQAISTLAKYCTAQVLNLTSHIEYAFDTWKITGKVLLDISAAYDTQPSDTAWEGVLHVTGSSSDVHDSHST